MSHQSLFLLQVDYTLTACTGKWPDYHFKIWFENGLTSMDLYSYCRPVWYVLLHNEIQLQ